MPRGFLSSFYKALLNFFARRISKQSFHSENACIECFPFTLLWRDLKTLQSVAILDLCLRKTRCREITWWTRVHRFRKAQFSKGFPLTWQRKTSVLKFVRFGEPFRKALFSWRISVDGRPNSRNKAAFWWRISVDGKPNSRIKAAFWWRISVDGKPNSRNKAAFWWRISVDGKSNRTNKSAFCGDGDVFA